MTEETVTKEQCIARCDSHKTWMKLNVALLTVLIALMGLFIVITYQSAAKADAAQFQGWENERFIISDTKATVVWRNNVDVKFLSVERKLDSIEAYLRNGKSKP